MKDSPGHKDNTHMHVEHITRVCMCVGGEGAVKATPTRKHVGYSLLGACAMCLLEVQEGGEQRQTAVVQ